MSSTTRVDRHPPQRPRRFTAHPGNMLRAGVAEAVGTFFLIHTGTATAGAGALGKSTAGSPPDSLAVALAFGLVLAALVGALGQVSGAHLNGAVTLGLAVTGKFPWRYVPSYLVFQLAGAIAGAGATWATFGSVVRDKAYLGATVPAEGVSDARAFVVEALITFLLVFVIMAVATDTRVPAALAAPSIGFALVAAVLIGGGITGGAVNPDRALGPAIMSGTYTSLWVYVGADIVGGIVAALLYTHVVGKATAPTMDTGDPQATRPAGDRGLATAADDST
ncbi:MAG: aquaporin [Actinomycetota bacterium]|nr:aquaporin [Actinomycetota bacterium]